MFIGLCFFDQKTKTLLAQILKEISEDVFLISERDKKGSAHFNLKCNVQLKDF